MRKAAALRLVALALGITAVLLVSTTGSSIATASGIPYPRLGNYYLGPIDNPATLARWDLAVVGAESYISSQYASVKSSNPNIKLVPYIASEEPSHNDPGAPSDSSGGYSTSWNLRRGDGSTITGWG